MAALLGGLLLSLAAPGPARRSQESFAARWQRFTGGALEQSELDVARLLEVAVAIVEAGTAQVETLEIVSPRSPYAVLGIELLVEEVGLQARLVTHGLRQPGARSFQLTAETPVTGAPGLDGLRFEVSVHQGMAGDVRVKAAVLSLPSEEELRRREERALQEAERREAAEAAVETEVDATAEAWKPEEMEVDGVELEVSLRTDALPVASAAIRQLRWFGSGDSRSTASVAGDSTDVNPAQLRKGVETLLSRTRQRFERLVQGLEYE